MTRTFTASTLAFTDAEARPLGQPTAEPLTGPITTRAHPRRGPRRPDQDRDLGVRGRQVAVGVRGRGELVHVLSGSMVCTEDGQDPVELTAGSTAVLPLGWRGERDVTQTLRKVFTIYRP